MPSLSYPTRLSIPGPWLLELESLQRLDSLVDSCSEKICAQRKFAIEEEVTIRKNQMLVDGKSPEYVEGQSEYLRKLVGGSYAFSGERRHIEVKTKDGGNAEGESFSQISAMARVQGKVPGTFSLAAVSGPNRIEISLKTWGSRDLEIAVSSADPNLAEEVFGKLEDWASDIQPKKWLQFWTSKGWGVAMLLFYLWVIGTAVGFARLMWTETGPSVVQQRAVALARQGVSQANEAEAIGLLLSIETGYEPSPPPRIQHYPPLRFYVLSCMALFMTVAAFFPPKGAIGIWAGKESLQRQRRWINFIFVSVPGFIATSILLPSILRALGFPN